jgi:hypothetical protein
MQSVKLIESYPRFSYPLGGTKIDSPDNGKDEFKTISDARQLIMESQRLRDELLRTAARLEAFSSKLLEEALHLKNVSDENEGEDTERS